MKSVFLRQSLAALFGAAALLLLPGCGKGKLTTSGNVVTGKVTYKDRSVPFGMVVFVSAETGDSVGQGPISSNGTYRVENLPTGEVQVAVLTKMPQLPGKMPPGGMAMPKPPNPGEEPPMPPPPPRRRGGGPGGPGGPGGGMPPDMQMFPGSMNIPPQQKAEIEALNDKYGTPKKSKLRYTVTSGEQTFDIPLK